MTKNCFWIALGVMLLIWSTGVVGAQTSASGRVVSFSTRNLGGPRIGFAVVPGTGEIARKMEENQIGRVISQFGWHFEHAVIANNDGPAFVTEFIPLIGGVEYGTAIISTTLAFGIREPGGYEFGVGPNLLFGDKVQSAVVIALGKTFDVSGVALPLNLAFVLGNGGARIGFLVGYAI
jgi:hypothetical protein